MAAARSCRRSLVPTPGDCSCIARSRASRARLPGGGQTASPTRCLRSLPLLHRDCMAEESSMHMFSALGTQEEGWGR